MFKYADPSKLGRSLLEGDKDHLLSQARYGLMKQEHQVRSLNNCIGELQQQAYAQGSELQDAQHGYIESLREPVRLQEEYAQRLELGDAHHGYVEPRREQFRLQEEISLKEKLLRDTQIRNMHEMVEMKRTQELRVDEFSVEKSREGHDTIQPLTPQLQSMQEQMNPMHDSGELQEVESNDSGRLSPRFQ